MHLCRVAKFVLPFFERTYRKVRDSEALLEEKLPDHQRSCVHENSLQITHDCQIIVPVYNTESYVEECVDSILKQETKYSYCVTVINDGSTDRSRCLLQKYESDPRVEIIDQENKGLSGARNAGLECIKGEYVMFVDSDDMLITGAIEALMNEARSQDADIVDGGHYKYYEGRVYGGLQLPHAQHLKSTAGYPCGKVFRAQLFEKIHFPVGYWFEDTVVMLVLFSLARNICSIPKRVFYYRENPHSISSTCIGNVRCIDSFYVTRRLLADRVILGLSPTQTLYENMFSQVRTNFDRILPIKHGKLLRRAVFMGTVRLWKRYFRGFTTINSSNRQLEKALIEGDYLLYFKELI